MIVRDLYRCSIDDLGKAIAASGQTLLRRGVVEPASAFQPADVEYLVAHPLFDPSLSFVVYDAGEPVAFIVSRIEGGEAVWSLLGGCRGAEHGMAMVLDEAMGHWRAEGAKRARKGLTGLLGSEPRLDEDAKTIALLEEHGFEVTTIAAEMVADLKKLALPSDQAEREAEARRKGYTVRPAEPDEVAVVARQYHPRRTGQMSLEFWNLLVRHLVPEALVVAELRRQFVGYAAYKGWTLADECPHLGPHFVDDVHRQAGIAPALLHQALRLAKDAGKERVRLNCGPDMVASYHRVGFAVAGRFCREAVAELD